MYRDKTVQKETPPRPRPGPRPGHDARHRQFRETELWETQRTPRELNGWQKHNMVKINLQWLSSDHHVI